MPAAGSVNQASIQKTLRQQYTNAINRAANGCGQDLLLDDLLDNLCILLYELLYDLLLYDLLQYHHNPTYKALGNWCYRSINTYVVVTISDSQYSKIRTWYIPVVGFRSSLKTWKVPDARKLQPTYNTFGPSPEVDHVGILLFSPLWPIRSPDTSSRTVPFHRVNIRTYRCQVRLARYVLFRLPDFTKNNPPPNPCPSSPRIRKTNYTDKATDVFLQHHLD